MSQQFCLKWNNHTTNMLQVFENLLTTEALVDVTLACDGLSLKAHKMVLSACSPFFQSLFLENPCKHPIVIMKDMRYCDLKAIIDFMYRGEVNVSHDQLSALLKTAETLKVKGLAEVTGENRQASGIVQHEIIQQNASTPTPTPVPPSAQRTDTPPLQGKRKRGRPRKRSLSDSNRSDDEGVPPKIKETNSDIEELSGDASMEATSDNRSSGGPISCNSQSQVPIHSLNNVNTFSKSHLSTSQDPQGEEPASGDENEFEVEPSKLLEQTLTTENVPSNSHNSTGPITLPSVSGLEISRRSMSSTDSGSQALVPVSIPSDSLGSNVQGPDSPQDVKPQILSFDDPPISPVAGTSHGSDRSLMMYMDQSGVASIPGPSNFQDNSALVPHDSQPQVKRTYVGRKKRLNLDPIIDLEPSPSLGPNTSPELTTSPELNTSLGTIPNLDTTIKEENDSNEANVPMAETEKNEVQSSGNEVNRKTSLVEEKIINRNPIGNQEPNPKLGPSQSLTQSTSLEQTTSVEPEIKEESDSNGADLPMAVTVENKAQSSKNEAKRRTNLRGEKRKNMDPIVSIGPNPKLGLTQSLAQSTSQEQATSLEPEIKEENDSNDADIPVVETEESEAQGSKDEAGSGNDGGQLRKIKRRYKNKVKRKTNIVRKKRVSLGSRPSSETITSLARTTSLEQTTPMINEESDSNKAIAMHQTGKSEDQNTKNEGGSHKGGRQTGKKESQNSTDEVKRKTYLGRKKRTNNPILTLEPIASLRPNTSPESNINLDPIINLETSTNHGSSINLDPIESFEQSTFLGLNTSFDSSITQNYYSNEDSPMNGTLKSGAQNSKNEAGSSKDGRQTGTNESQNSKNEGENFNDSSYIYSRYKNYTRIKKSLLQFKCEKCDYAATSKASLKSHMFTHTDQHPYLCPYCEYKGKRHTYLKKHLLHKHYNLCNLNMLRTPDEDYYK